MLRMFADAVL